jgi:hypothetical protein
MKKLTAILLIFLFIVSNICFAEVEKKQAANSTVEIMDSRNQIIKFTDKGIEPQALHMKKEDSIVFFLNDTKDSLTSLVVEFGDKVTHCGGAKMQTGDHGRVSSVRPFGPNDFTSTCFHEAGVYPIKVYGLKSNPKGIESKIYVE